LLAQGIGDLFECQANDPEAPAITGDCHPGMRENDPEIDDHQREADQQQTESRMTGGGTGTHLMHLAIVTLDTEAVGFNPCICSGPFEKSSLSLFD
jgi:hypothetical protein